MPDGLGAMSAAEVEAAGAGDKIRKFYSYLKKACQVVAKLEEGGRDASATALSGQQDLASFQEAQAYVEQAQAVLGVSSTLPVPYPTQPFLPPQKPQQMTVSSRTMLWVGGGLAALLALGATGAVALGGLYIATKPKKRRGRRR